LTEGGSPAEKEDLWAQLGGSGKSSDFDLIRKVDGSGQSNSLCHATLFLIEEARLPFSCFVVAERLGGMGPS